MNIIHNVAKASVLATIIFWAILYKTIRNDELLFYIFLSLIPIFLSCLITILFTVCPFYWFKGNTIKTNKHIFKTYFPYYAIISFLGSLLAIIVSDFELFVISFFSAAYITTAHSWMWFSKN